MAQVEGLVQARSGKSKFGTYGMMVDDKWYNSKFEIKANKGDEVSFDDGEKNYIKGLKILSSSGPATGSSESRSGVSGGKSYSRGKFPIEQNDGQRSIIRQNSLTNAVNALGHAGMIEGLKIDDMIVNIINVAREFEAFSAGDLDREAKAQLDEAFDPEG